MSRQNPFVPPDKGVMVWIEQPRIPGKKPRFFAPPALFINDKVIRYSNDQLSRALNHASPVGESSRFQNPGFRTLLSEPVNADNPNGVQYAFWASWPSAYSHEARLFYYPTRFLLVRIDPAASFKAGVNKATVILETTPGDCHKKARAMFRAAVIANATNEGANGLPVNSPDFVRMVPPISLMEEAGRVGVLIFNHTTGKYTRTDYKNGKPI